jgi:hypothetical protein
LSLLFRVTGVQTCALPISTKFDLDFPAKGCLAQIRRGRCGRVEASRNRSGHLDLG